VTGTGSALRTGAVVVTYNSSADIDRCLDALAGQDVAPIVVVDNASADDTVERVRTRGEEIRVVANRENRGLAAANNQGIAECEGVDAVLLVNPDTEVLPGAVATLAGVLATRPDVGLVGPRVVNPDGSLYPSVRRFPDPVTALGHAVLLFVAPGNRWTRRYRMADWDHSHAADVDWVAFTFVLIRRSALEQVGGLDERYFMYVEDVDTCWRLREAGWVVAYEPDAVVSHRIGGSSASAPYRMIVHHHRSLWRFARRTARGPGRLALPFLAAGLAARTAVAWLQHWIRRRPHAAP
jgi:GT2 family glycosyltransferase